MKTQICTRNWLWTRTHYFSLKFIHNERIRSSSDNLTYRECLKILGVIDGCTWEEARDAFLRLARKFHPDAGLETSNAEQFNQVEMAYRTLKKHLADQETEKEIVEKDFDIKHTVPQHRQFLSNEGIGYGTPSERLKQYQRYRVARAVETVAESRMEKVAIQQEDALVVQNKQAAKKHKIRNAMDRLVEDLIQESMSKGEFENLSGQGKPLNHSNHNPFVDTTTHKLNEVLINNGFTPEWILLLKEINQDKNELRYKLQQQRFQFGTDSLDDCQMLKWKESAQKFTPHIENINSKIQKYNLIVPFLYKQLAPLQMKLETEQLRSCPLQKPKNCSETQNASVKTVDQTSGFLSIFSTLFSSRN